MFCKSDREKVEKESSNCLNYVCSTFSRFFLYQTRQSQSPGRERTDSIGARTRQSEEKSNRPENRILLLPMRWQIFGYNVCQQRSSDGSRASLYRYWNGQERELVFNRRKSRKNIAEKQKRSTRHLSQQLKNKERKRERERDSERRKGKNGKQINYFLWELGTSLTLKRNHVLSVYVFHLAAGFSRRLQVVWVGAEGKVSGSCNVSHFTEEKLKREPSDLGQRVVFSENRNRVFGSTFAQIIVGSKKVSSVC